MARQIRIGDDQALQDAWIARAKARMSFAKSLPLFPDAPVIRDLIVQNLGRSYLIDSSGNQFSARLWPDERITADASRAASRAAAAAAAWQAAQAAAIAAEEEFDALKYLEELERQRKLSGRWGPWNIRVDEFLRAYEALDRWTSILHATASDGLLLVTAAMAPFSEVIVTDYLTLTTVIGPLLCSEVSVTDSLTAETVPGRLLLLHPLAAETLTVSTSVEATMWLRPRTADTLFADTVAEGTLAHYAARAFEAMELSAKVPQAWVTPLFIGSADKPLRDPLEASTRAVGLSRISYLKPAMIYDLMGLSTNADGHATPPDKSFIDRTTSAELSTVAEGLCGDPYGILNGWFEGETIEPWDYSPYYTTAFLTFGGIREYGYTCAEVTASQPGGPGLLYQRIHVVPGVELTVSAWYKTVSNPDDINRGIGILNIGDVPGDSSYGEAFSFFMVDYWRQLSVTFTPTGDYVYVSLISYTMDVEGLPTVYWDGVESVET